MYERLARKAGFYAAHFAPGQFPGPRALADTLPLWMGRISPPRLPTTPEERLGGHGAVDRLAVHTRLVLAFAAGRAHSRMRMLRQLVAGGVAYVAFFVFSWATLPSRRYYGLFTDREPILFGMLGASDVVIFSICIVGSITVGFATLSLLSRLGAGTN